MIAQITQNEYAFIKPTQQIKFSTHNFYKQRLSKPL